MEKVTVPRVPKVNSDILPFDVSSVRVDRVDIKYQDDLIRQKRRDGFFHYETVALNSGEYIMRFRRGK